jgi:opacity protein-like surface antigen
MRSWRNWQRAAGALLVLVIVAISIAAPARADVVSRSHSFVFSVAGAPAFPTGRFGEQDKDSNPPKDGHKSGWSGGADVGYFFSDLFAAGLSYSYTSFDLDPYSAGRSGSTKISSAQVWGRLFFRAAYQHWQPFVTLGAGVGRPKATIEYDPPEVFPGLPATVSKLESTVSICGTVTGGIGVLIPVNHSIGVSFEPRYTTVYSKGTARTDTFHMTSGEIGEVKKDNDGNRLKAKSNTNWWELRFGVQIFIQ